MKNFMKPKILVPKPVIKGDTIGIVAPASPFDEEKFFKGIRILEPLGFDLYIPEEILGKKGYIEGEAKERALLIEKMFADKNIKGIICARGGFGSIKTLPFIDFEIIRQNPKHFIGFSDISALLSAFYNICGMMVFHGPLVTSFSEIDTASIESFSKALALEDIDVEINNGVIIKKGFSKGKLTGGNLATLCHLLGTPFQPDFGRHILFLEDIGEKPYKIDRMLTQMKLAGCFEDISGILLGSFENCGNPEDIYSIAASVFKEDEFPILGGIDSGHGKRNLVLPIGADVFFDTNNKTLKITYPEKTV